MREKRQPPVTGLLLVTVSSSVSCALRPLPKGPAIVPLGYLLVRLPRYVTVRCRAVTCVRLYPDPCCFRSLRKLRYVDERVPALEPP